jgi:lambda repressor-like predicted transcriptional regulator
MGGVNGDAARPSVTARLKSALALRGLTVAGFAREIGVRRPQVWHALTGERGYPHIVAAVAKAIGEPVQDVQREIDEMRAARREAPHQA